MREERFLKIWFVFCVCATIAIACIIGCVFHDIAQYQFELQEYAELREITPSQAFAESVEFYGYSLWEIFWWGNIAIVSVAGCALLFMWLSLYFFSQGGFRFPINRSDIRKVRGAIIRLFYN